MATAGTDGAGGGGSGSSTTLSDSVGSDGGMGLAAEALGASRGAADAEPAHGRRRERSRSFILEDGDGDLIEGDPDDPLGVNELSAEALSGADSGGETADTEDEAPRTRSRSRSMRLEIPSDGDGSSGVPGGGIAGGLGGGDGDGGGRARAGSGVPPVGGGGASGLSYKTRNILNDLGGHLTATGHAPQHHHPDRSRHDAPGLPRRDSSSESEEEAAERRLAEEERVKALEAGGTGGGGSGGAAGGAGGGGSEGRRPRSRESSKKSKRSGAKKADKEQQFDMMIKLLLLGDGGVGKTSLINRVSENKFSHTMMHTAGVDFTTKFMTVAGKRIKVQLWDTAGQERFHVITRAYYRGANGIVLVYDQSTDDPEEDSFANVQYWMSNIKQHAAPTVESILVANKTDLPRKIEKSRGAEMAERYGIKFFEASAKSGKGVPEAFKAVVEDIVLNHAGEPQLSRTGGRMPPPAEDKAKGKCVVQ
mmetsp:Transcript_1033/g.3288  ORF Transcript_1033/g.3288 Transcript_1033/m.3288 type:complete len:478 (-) Transcript_1033:70-1503(-)